MKVVSYKDLSKEQVLDLISQIPQDFEGWRNYNSNTDAGLPFLLYDQKRFEKYDYYFLLDDSPIACSGFYEFDDKMLIAVRAYNWKNYRDKRYIQNKKLLTKQIARSYLEFNKPEVYITVNNYNKRILDLYSKQSKTLSKKHLSIIPHLEIQSSPIAIQGVLQYVAKLKINDEFKKTDYWSLIMEECNNDI